MRVVSALLSMCLIVAASLATPASPVAAQAQPNGRGPTATRSANQPVHMTSTATVPQSKNTGPGKTHPNQFSRLPRVGLPLHRVIVLRPSRFRAELSPIPFLAPTSSAKAIPVSNPPILRLQPVPSMSFKLSTSSLQSTTVQATNSTRQLFRIGSANRSI